VGEAKRFDFVNNASQSKQVTDCYADTPKRRHVSADTPLRRNADTFLPLSAGKLGEDLVHGFLRQGLEFLSGLF
jgi:hypothetical protein